MRNTEHGCHLSRAFRALIRDDDDSDARLQKKEFLHGTKKPAGKKHALHKYPYSPLIVAGQTDCLRGLHPYASIGQPLASIAANQFPPKKFPFAITMQHVDRSRCGSRAYNPAPRSSHLSPILMNDTMKSRYPHPFDGLATAIHIHIE